MGKLRRDLVAVVVITSLVSLSLIAREFSLSLGSSLGIGQSSEPRTAQQIASSASPSPSPPPLLPSFSLQDSQFIQSNTSCKFNGCPEDESFFYVYVGHRNRAINLNRMARMLAADALGGRRSFDPRCLCLAVADFPDRGVTGPPVEVAIKDDWPLDYHILKVPGEFSLAGGFSQVIQKVMNTPADRSLVIKLDADMAIYPGFLARAKKNIVLSQQAYAPVCWSQWKNETDWYAGRWRVTGSGIIGFYKQDILMFCKDGVLPLSDKTSHGQDDHELTNLLHKTIPTYHVMRDCAPELWHLYHRKEKWQHSIDGLKDVHETKRTEPWDPNSDWKLPLPRPDGPVHLQAGGLLNVTRCYNLDHKLYPR